LKKLIHEIHRRSLWQVLGIYLAGSWVALQVVEQLAEAASLPPWVRPFALALLVIGFPIVMATAFVQEGIGARESAADTGESPGHPGEPPASRPAPSGGAARFLTWRNAIAGGVVALAVWGLVALGWVFLGGAGPEGVAPAGARADPSRALLPQGDQRDRSIAVLPFANLSPDADNAFFADGVHESVLTQLSKIGDLRVLSRASMIRYRDTDLSLREIAEEVGAGAILQGSVQRAGDRIRISAQLIDPATEENLWADQYDGSVSEIFDFQSDVALAVATALRSALAPDEVAAVRRRSTESVTALDFYMRGLEAYNRFENEDNEEAIRLFRRAIAEDSSFAQAWAGVGDGYLQRVQFFGYPVEWADSAEAMARTALELDPRLAEGYKTLGFSYIVRGRSRQAAAEWERAIDLNPNFQPALNNLGVAATWSGEMDDGVRWYKRAFLLDPNNPLSRTNVASAYAWLGEPEIAQRWVDDARAMNPEDPTLKFFQWVIDIEAAGPERANARLESALPELEGAPTLLLAALADGAMYMKDADGAERFSRLAFVSAPEGGFPFGWFDGRITRAWALSRSGLDGEALELLNRVREELEKRVGEGADAGLTWYTLAQARALLGSRASALEALETAWENGWAWVRSFDLDPIFDDYRDEPSIAQLRQRVVDDLARQRRELEAEERASGERR